MIKTFSINQAPYSIRCLLYCQDGSRFDRVVIYGHGFGGHKGNGAARRFAEYLLSKYKRIAVLCFDLPCHGDDARKKLTLSDCDAYLRLVIDYAREKLGAAELYLYATSFGAYLTLNDISTHGSPFRKIALRCPAIPMHEVLDRSIIGEPERSLLNKGKDALVGFDRKIKLSRDFLDELREADIRCRDYLPYAEDMLILHGTKDEIVPIDAVRDFADRNVIEFVPIRNADHRFQDPGTMTEAIARIVEFFGF